LAHPGQAENLSMHLDDVLSTDGPEPLDGGVSLFLLDLSAPSSHALQQISLNFLTPLEVLNF
jgi:hypothetical protein